MGNLVFCSEPVPQLMKPALLLTDTVVMQANGRPRGFGFVTFEHEEQAEQAFHFPPGHHIDGKKVSAPKVCRKGKALFLII